MSVYFFLYTPPNGILFLSLILKKAKIKSMWHTPLVLKYISLLSNMMSHFTDHYNLCLSSLLSTNFWKQCNVMLNEEAAISCYFSTADKQMLEHEVRIRCSTCKAMKTLCSQHLMHSLPHLCWAGKILGLVIKHQLTRFKIALVDFYKIYKVDFCYYGVVLFQMVWKSQTKWTKGWIVG